MKVKMNIFICLTLFALLFYVKCARILSIFPTESRSHFILGLTLGESLAKRGHEYVFVTPHEYQSNERNLTIVTIQDTFENPQDAQKIIYTANKVTFYQLLKLQLEVGLILSNKIHNSSGWKTLIFNDKFDLVIVESFIGESFYGLGQYFKCPLILLSPGPISFYNNFMVDNPLPSAYNPNILSRFSGKMNFLQRLMNGYHNIIARYIIFCKLLPQYDAIIKNSYLPNGPSLDKIIYNISMILTYSNRILHDPIPLMPQVKEVGGFHVTPAKPLPNDVQEFLDGANEGVILFSLGSILRSCDLPEKKLSDVLKVLGKSSFKVLWKFEGDLQNCPSNVKTVTWLPQNDILAHPNVKVFLTHGGLLSITEAVYHGVPVIGIPVFWDQYSNMANVVSRAYGIMIPFEKLNELTLSEALKEIRNNKYKKSALRWSRLMKDEPVQPMELAIYWIEYVLRFGGAEHLKSLGLKLRWYQQLFLDALLVLVSLILICVYVIRRMVRFCILACLKKNSGMKTKLE